MAAAFDFFPAFANAPFGWLDVGVGVDVDVEDVVVLLPAVTELGKPPVAVGLGNLEET